MRIYTKAGDLSFQFFKFPDGQPHFKLDSVEKDWSEVTIETSIRNPDELFKVLLVNDTLRQLGYLVRLDIRYLMGARMDRAIDVYQPFTLATICRLLNAAWFYHIRILDVHSDRAIKLLHNSENLLPFDTLRSVLAMTGPVVPIIPDKGAIPRCFSLLNRNKVDGPYIQCEKTRDMATGELSGFKVFDLDYIAGKNCLIVDDICDGGGTFVGIAEKLKEAGAHKVYLYVTHGIFSKGPVLSGIEKAFTTDSYYEDKFLNVSLVKLPISMEIMK